VMPSTFDPAEIDVIEDDYTSNLSNDSSENASTLRILGLCEYARELEKQVIVIPEIPWPGGQSQAHYWETAARNLEQNHPVGGSNLRAAVAKLAREAARVLRGDS
jgi:hypothetical protein